MLWMRQSQPSVEASLLYEAQAVCRNNAQTHLDQQRQRPALHDLSLVVIILEGQGPQGSRCCTLHLEVPAVQQPHQRRNAAIRPHLQQADTIG